jgi:hypothetical protein
MNGIGWAKIFSAGMNPIIRSHGPGHFLQKTPPFRAFHPIFSLDRVFFFQKEKSLSITL